MSDSRFRQEDHRFGFVDPRSLSQIPPEEEFLSWEEDTNAAQVIPRYALDSLGAPPAREGVVFDDSFDLMSLGHSLAQHWRRMRLGDTPSDSYEGAGFLQSFDFHTRLKGNDAQLKVWSKAEEENVRGGNYFQANKPAEAIEAYQKALALYESIGDIKGAGMCHGNIGLVYLHFGNPGPAGQECLEALQAHESVDYRKGQLMHLTNLALATMKLEQWENALQFLSMREQVERLIDPTLRAITQTHKAHCHFRLGNTEEGAQDYEQALKELTAIQTPGRLQEAANELSRTAVLLGRVDPEGQIAQTRQNLLAELRALNPECPPLAAPIVRRFQQAREKGDKIALHEAIAQCPRWSVLAWEWLLATSAIFEISGQAEHAFSYLALAEQMALGLCRSTLVRWPLDATKLFKCWNIEMRVAAAQAFSYKLRAMGNAENGNSEAAFQALQASVRLYLSIGHRNRRADWYQEWALELDFDPEDHNQMFRVVIRSKSRAQEEDFEGALADLQTALGIAESKGSALNVADKLLRIAILHHQSRRMEEAADWFRRADEGFQSLEKLGPSLKGELGRCDNKLKMGIQFGEFLYDAGRFGEAIAVLHKCLLEIDWFLESPGPTLSDELLQRTREFKTRGLYTLTQARFSLGSFEKALESAREGLEWSEKVQDQSAKAAAYQGLAHAYLELALFPQAIESASADVEIQRTLGVPREIAVALNTLADTQFRSGDSEGAAESCLEALHLLQDSDDVLRSTILSGLAAVEQARGNLEEAHRRFLESLRLHQADNNLFGIVSTTTSLAHLSLQMDRRAKAEALAQEAWQKSEHLQSHSVRVSAGHVLALSKMEEDSIEQWIEASNVLFEVCGLIDTMRQDIATESLKALQTGSRSGPYDLLIESLSRLALATGAPDLPQRVFDVVERSKARSLIEAIAGQAQQQAEESGFQLAGITHYVRDPREELPRLGFKQIHEMLVLEAD